MSGFYALPPGVDFAEAVVAGMMDRHAGQPPEALAGVTIHANSLRTLNALRAAFEARGPLLLPRLRLIAELGEGPIDAPLGRRLGLGALIAQLVATRPVLGGGQSIAALARSLAAVMAEMQSEGVGPEALTGLDVGDHAEHWRLSLSFLGIAADYYLTGPPRDREARQRAAAERCAHDWAQGMNLPEGPVWVVGSTGSHGATRMFMEAVARLPGGGVILPGFDFDQPRAVWDGLANGGDDHPQARFAPLVAALGQPQPWPNGTAADPARNRLVSLALRPAPVTDQWIAEGPALGDLMAVTQNLTLIEAPDPQAEAEAIAVTIRRAVERGERVTLIAADRLLTRRVTAALDRWDLIPDDSAGQPLTLTMPGLFLRQVAALFGQVLTIDVLLALLKNSVTASGAADPGEHLRQTRELELHLRERGPAFPTGGALRDWAATRGKAAVAWAAWLGDQVDAIDALATDRAATPLPERLARHLALAEALAAGPGGSAEASGLWQRQAGGLARGVMRHLAAEARDQHRLTAEDFAALLHDELAAQAVRSGETAHPLIRIRGPREARTEAVGLVILGGLNEGSWPQGTGADPWLSRQMRLAAGLTVPERRIGLSAHDLQQAVAAGRVILTRAKRDAEAETVPSRWLNRLTNLLAGLPGQNGPQALNAMRVRGREALDWARALGRPAGRTPPAPRPSPRPAGPAFSRLSVTQVSTLIRDPYAIYARQVLGLKPLPALRPSADASLRGEVFHTIAQQFLSPAPAAGTPPGELRARFLALAEEALAAQVPWPAARAFWAERLRQASRQLMLDEADRLAKGRPILIERQVQYPVPGLPLTIVARPDRIDELPDGRAHVYDYKSGTAPKPKQIAAYDKQLPLTAALITRGAFTGTAARDIAGMSYIQLSREGGTEPRDMTAEEVGEVWDRFVALAAAYLDGSLGYTARRSMAEFGFGSDYDHLSRYGEWTAATPPTLFVLPDPDDPEAA